MSYEATLSPEHFEPKLDNNVLRGYHDLSFTFESKRDTIHDYADTLGK